MEEMEVVLGSESLRFGNRLRSKATPMFPLKNCGRPKSADAQIKPKVFTNNSRCSKLQSKAVVTKLLIPKYKQVDYKRVAVAKIDTGSKPPVPVQTTIKTQHLTPRCTSTNNSNAANNATKYPNIQSKVDTKDPAPWIHTSKRVLEELAELDGFCLNPRFSGIVQSKSFDSVQDILEILDHEGEGPVVKLHRNKRPQEIAMLQTKKNEETETTEAEMQKDEEVKPGDKLTS